MEVLESVWAPAELVSLANPLGGVLRGRVFQLLEPDLRWRQVHHHGAIYSPEALKRYQDAVRG